MIFKGNTTSTSILHINHQKQSSMLGTQRVRPASKYVKTAHKRARTSL